MLATKGEAEGEESSRILTPFEETSVGGVGGETLPYIKGINEDQIIQLPEPVITPEASVAEAQKPEPASATPSIEVIEPAGHIEVVEPAGQAAVSGLESREYNGKAVLSAIEIHASEDKTAEPEKMKVIVDNCNRMNHRANCQVVLECHRCIVLIACAFVFSAIAASPI